jgi:hypothetical protein
MRLIVCCSSLWLLLSASALPRSGVASPAPSLEFSADTPAEAGAPGRGESRQLDEIEVVAKGTAADLPDTLSTDLITWRETPGAPVDVQDMLVRIPGVGATGQNGAFETFSIRGSGGNGILVLLGGMPITAQRRAGVPISFVEPALLGALSVTRGPVDGALRSRCAGRRDLDRAALVRRQRADRRLRQCGSREPAGRRPRQRGFLDRSGASPRRRQ